MPNKYDVEFTHIEALEIFCRIVSKTENLPLVKCRTEVLVKRRLIKYSKANKYRLIAWKIFGKHISQENFNPKKYVPNEAVIYRLVSSVKNGKPFRLYELHFVQIELFTGSIRAFKCNSVKALIPPLKERGLINSFKNKQLAFICTDKPSQNMEIFHACFSGASIISLLEDLTIELKLIRVINLELRLYSNVKEYKGHFEICGEDNQCLKAKLSSNTQMETIEVFILLNEINSSNSCGTIIDYKSFTFIHSIGGFKNLIERPQMLL